MKENNRMSNPNIRLTLYFTIGIFVMLIFFVYYTYNIYTECSESKQEELREVIILQNSTCYIQNLDIMGNGFTFPTEYCEQLKYNCESSHHEMLCSWDEVQFYNNTFICRCQSII